MEIAVSKLAERSLMLLDEDAAELEEARSFGDMGMELRRLVEELMPEAAASVMAGADLGDIDESLDMRGIPIVADNGSELEMELPADFLRLVEFRMSDWDRSMYGWCAPQPVTTRITLPGIRMSHRPGRRVIDIRGTSPGALPTVAQYLPRPVVKEGRIWIPGSLADAVARRAADMARDVITN